MPRTTNLVTDGLKILTGAFVYLLSLGSLFFFIYFLGYGKLDFCRKKNISYIFFCTISLCLI